MARVGNCRLLYDGGQKKNCKNKIGITRVVKGINFYFNIIDGEFDQC